MNKIKQTRGNTQETDCQSKYQTNSVMWDDVWEQVRQVTRKDQYDEKCWILKKTRKPIFLENGTKIQLEVNQDGYGKVNLTTTRLDDGGKPVMRDYTHNETGKKAKRKDTREEQMYLHHLAYLHRTYGTPEFLKRSSSEPESRHTLSHLCNRRACFKPDHIVFEPHVYNLSRGACNAELCNRAQHSPRCITHQNSVVQTVAELNHRFGYTSGTLNEESEGDEDDQSRAVSSSTKTSSDTHPAGEALVLRDDDDDFI